jgi:hypothetical protein
MIAAHKLHATSPSLNVEYVIHGVGPREVDPLELGSMLWPEDKWAQYQRRVVYSVWNNKETIVKAGNKLGKDWMGGFIAPLFFLTRHPCRIVTTSAKDQHLRVLWGEIGQRIRTARTALDYKRGGPLIINHQDIRKLVDGERCPLSYLSGMVAGADSMASMQGHHIPITGDNIPRTMFMCDEASSVNHEYYRMARSWFNRAYIFGNPWPCNNFFYHAFKGMPGSEDRGGDIASSRYIGCYPTPQETYEERDKDGAVLETHQSGYQRKVFTLRAQDSPNVRLGEAQIRNGKEPTNEIIVPGLKPYDEYEADRRQWDAIQQCVSLDGEFYEGQEVRMFPQAWLHQSAQLARKIGMMHPSGRMRTKARGIGIDCAMGGDDTSMAAVDDVGVLEVRSAKTPDTNVIVGEVEAFVRKWGIEWDRVFFDISGGGKQHADRLRAKGYNVRTIHFGSAPADDVDLIHNRPSDRKRTQDIVERRIAYKNKRAEMYGNLRELLDPALLLLPREQRAIALKGIMGDWNVPAPTGEGVSPPEFYGFAIPCGSKDEPFQHPDALAELHRQMGPIPLSYTEEGIMYLIPKHRRDADDDKPNLTQLLGCSPDELDAVVLAVHAMLRPVSRPMYL